MAPLGRMQSRKRESGNGRAQLYLGRLGFRRKGPAIFTVRFADKSVRATRTKQVLP
jgi:hypothetical protein